MKLLNRLILKNIKLNKKITVVIIIGIILSTFLLTSIITIAFSFKKSLLEHSKEINGNYHYEFINVPMTDINAIKNNDNIETLFYTQEEGDIPLDDILNIEASLKIIGVTKEGLNELAIEIEEGRMPQNSSEIVITNKLKKYQSSKLKFGEQITAPSKSSSDTVSKQYTIVGTVNISDNYLESAEANSSNATEFTTFSLLENNEFSTNKNVNVYVGLKDLNKRIETLAQILNLDEQMLQKLSVPNIVETEENIQNNESNKYVFLANNVLLSMETGKTKDETSTMVYAVIFVVLGIVIFTSVYCIRNSFDISISERIKQYGTLSSLGATKRQIYINVIKEALLLWLIATPIGIALGLLFIYYFFKTVGINYSENLFSVQFIFDTNIISLLLIVLFSFVIIYFSAIKSARKMSKLSPIEAIKNNQNITISSKSLKSPKIIKKIFGIGGEISYKNIKRNKRRYRTTIVSIVISITLFITALSFTKYAINVSDTYIESEQFNIYLNSDDYKKLEEVTKDEEINKNRYELFRIDSIEINEKEKHYTDDVKKINEEPTISIISLGEQEYKRYLKLLGLDYEDTKDKAILINTIMESIKEDNKTTYQAINILDYNEGDTISFFKNDELEELKIAKVTRETPMVLISGSYAYFVISDELMNKICETSQCFLYIQTEDDLKLEKYIENNYSEAYWSLGNNSETMREQQAMWTMINIFLYGFIIITALIGITNIFNTITTSMMSRQREFAHLKAIGMTTKEFNRMIRLESSFYGLKSIILGIVLGLIFSYFVYLAFSINVELEYIFPIDGIIISILAVVLLLICIMKYSLYEINKKNIIETIRNENI